MSITGGQGWHLGMLPCAVPPQELWAAMLWGLWEDWDGAIFMQSTRKAPGQGAPRALLGAGGLCWSAVLVLYTVLVSLEAACQGGGTWLGAPYLPGPCWGCALVTRAARRALAGPCFSEPHCSLLGMRTRVRLCLPAAADICLLRLSRNGKPFRGSFTSFLGFVSWCPGCRQGELCCPAPVVAG